MCAVCEFSGNSREFFVLILGLFPDRAVHAPTDTVLWTRQYGKGTSRYGTIPNLAAAAGTCLPGLPYFSLVHARVLYDRSIRTVSNLR